MTAPDDPPEETAEVPWPALLEEHRGLRARLLAAYAEPHRGYHDVRHLTEVLDHLHLLLAEEHLPEQADALVLAAWFHDAVYDGHPDDEERSAVLAETELTVAGAPSDLVSEVARLVRITAEHRPREEDRAGQVLCDADLAILAAAPERYAAYVRDVRTEYADLDAATFRAGRERVLRALLDKPTLFHTAYAREHWEERARANITAELDAPGSP